MRPTIASCFRRGPALRRITMARRKAAVAFFTERGRSPMHPNGHAALVTGGGSGLGRATAERLAALGAKVAILDVNGDAARAVAAEIGGLGLVCDVTSPQGAAAAIAEARTRHGSARIL